jgi:hypothetical protein
LSAVFSVYVVAFESSIRSQFVVLPLLQRSQIRPTVVPEGPLHVPPLAVSFAPTTALPEIVGAEVTLTAADAPAGAARPSASTRPSNAILDLRNLLANNSPPPCGCVPVRTYCLESTGGQLGRSSRVS